MRNTTYMGLMVVAAGIGGLIVLIAPLSAPGAILGLSSSLIGLVLVTMGAMATMMFFGYAYMQGKLFTETGSSKREGVLSETYRIMDLIGSRRDIPDRDRILDDLAMAREAIDRGDYERADQALHDIERRLETQGRPRGEQRIDPRR